MKLRQKIEEKFFLGLMIFATWFILIILAVIIYSVFEKGLKAMSWEIVSQIPKGGYYYGKGGGILNAITGSLLLASGATLVAFVIGLPVALYMNVFLVRRQRLVNLIRFLLDLVWGIPSIVYGAFGFTIMILIGLQTSLLAGIITVSLFILPIMIRSMDEILRTVPVGLMEAAYSLGANKSETAFKIFTRQTISGIITAILLYRRVYRQSSQFPAGTCGNAAPRHLLPAFIAGTGSAKQSLCIRPCSDTYHIAGQPVLSGHR
jgi:phosphate transport system permease protein